MRVHLLLILFFASTILARSARDKRDTATTVLPLSTSTNAASNESMTTGTFANAASNKSTTTSTFANAASNESTTTGVSTNEDDCHTIICRINNALSKPYKISSKLLRSMLQTFKNTLESASNALTTTSDVVLRVTMQPLLTVMKLAIWATNWILQQFF